MRSLAERLRGFSSCSCAEGRMTLLFTARQGVSLRPKKSCYTFPSTLPARIKFFTMRSSSEW